MKQYKPLIFFLIRFLGSYILMILIYNWYLNQYLPNGIPDPFTKFSSDLAANGFNFLGFETKSIHYGQENFMRLLVEGKYASIVNEGCNAISVLIIFVAFILAFYTTFKQTFLYIIGSLILLFVMNIFRIILLTYIYRFHTEYSKMSHDYLFPAIIYGSIIFLWIVWIKLFVIKKKTNAE
ncbi:MAG: exosortase family protein XrtF [Weeksellaceae bacterium]|nr:exosortase family protein XrtF [Weeksellaceae bacterium]